VSGPEHATSAKAIATDKPTIPHLQSGMTFNVFSSGKTYRKMLKVRLRRLWIPILPGNPRPWRNYLSNDWPGCTLAKGL